MERTPSQPQQFKQERLRALRFLDVATSSAEGSREHAFIERSLKEIIERTRQAVDDMKKEGDELDSDERNIELKIRKKQEELERTEKRMKSLESVRPQFMDEVEKLEKELQRHYDVYIEKFRNLDYLEHELGKYHKIEEEKKEEHERKLKKMRERLLKDEVELLRGEKGADVAGSKGAGPRGGSGAKRAPSDDVSLTLLAPRLATLSSHSLTPPPLPHTPYLSISHRTIPTRARRRGAAGAKLVAASQARPSRKTATRTSFWTTKTFLTTTTMTMTTKIVTATSRVPSS